MTIPGLIIMLVISIILFIAAYAWIQHDKSPETQKEQAKKKYNDNQIKLQKKIVKENLKRYENVKKEIEKDSSGSIAKRFMDRVRKYR